MVWTTGRRRSIAFFVTFCVLLCALAAALNIGWILLTWREIIIAVAGLLLFLAIIAGLILNTIFLVREIRRNEQQDAFLNAMTHELKTPLASIRLYLETLQTRDVEPAKRIEFYQIMLEDCDRLLGSVEQVLQAGRVSRQRLLLRGADVDLGSLVEECVATARRQHRLAPESLTFELMSGDEFRVRGERDELRAAVANLIDNAVKYSPNGVRVRVEVLRWDRRSAAVRVHDQGLGIPESELKRVFKRFYRMPGIPARIKGSGLGLFIVESVVKKHGGRTFADSPGAGMGSTFTITLPVTVGQPVQEGV